MTPFACNYAKGRDFQKETWHVYCALHYAVYGEKYSREPKAEAKTPLISGSQNRDEQEKLCSEPFQMHFRAQSSDLTIDSMF